MLIDKKVDRRQLTKLLNGMYQYVVKIRFDSESNYITITDSQTTVQLKVVQ